MIFQLTIQISSQDSLNKTKSQKDNNSDKKPTVEGEEQEEDYNQEEFDKEDDIQDNENEKPNL